MRTLAGRRWILAVVAALGLLGSLLATTRTASADAGVLAAPAQPTLRLLHWNIAGAAEHGGNFRVVNRLITEIQARRPDVISLNEVCIRQYDRLLERLGEIGYAMEGQFAKTVDSPLLTCTEGTDLRNDAGNAVLVRGTVSQRQRWTFGRYGEANAPLQLFLDPIPPVPPVVLSDRGVACLTAQLTAAPPPSEPVKVCTTHLSTAIEGDNPPTRVAELEARELARVFGSEAALRPFILMGDLNLTPTNPAMDSLYAPEAGTTGEFWETDTFGYCTPVICEGPEQSGSPTQGNRKIDYTFVSRKHFSFALDNVEVFDAGTCEDRPCSDHRIFRSEVKMHQLTTPYGQIRNQSSGKCLLLRGAADNAAAVQYTCLSYADQRWRFEHLGWGEYLLRNQSSGKCLMPRTISINSPIVQYPCNANDRAMHWRPGDPAAGSIRNVLAGAGCILVRGAANDAPAVGYTCLPQYADQLWTYP